LRRRCTYSVDDGESNAQSPNPNDLTAIAERAYIYAYPLVLMEATGAAMRGTLPSGVVRLDAATNHVWLLGRTQTNGVGDYDNVHAFQDGMRLAPLSQYPGEVAPSATVQHTSSGGSPVVAVKAMSPTTFFATFAQELKIDPPHAADQQMVSDLARIGVVPGEDFDPSKLAPEQLKAIDDGARAATARIEQFVATAGVKKPGWTSFQGVLGRYGTNYVARDATARIAIGANPPEDAVYMSSEADSSGQPLSGSMGYRMHFDASQLPPVLAFWSVTAYDESGYFIPNPINRYAIGDRDKLRFNPDGSLDLFIESEDPGADRESNWLPSGAGPFNLTLRLYWPKDAILNGTWHPPALVRVP
jgi:hypothetical protein